MWNAFLHGVPYALVNAASPTIPVVAIALLALPRGRRALVAYFIGCVIATVVTTALVLTVFSSAKLGAFSMRNAPAWLDIGVGVVAIGFAVRLQARKPRPDTKPSRFGATDGFVAALGIGLYMELINLFTPPAYLVAVMSLTQEHLSTTDIVVCSLLLAIVMLSPVWLLIVISALAPRRTDEIITWIRGLAHRYGHVVLVATLFLVGLFLVGRGMLQILTR